ncbi:MAG: bifunctional homocysteine S-methyltransferase/methylenetetrahydrofolate reductase [Nitrospinota bacterium]|nr:bifunctional homocysteine S-methyltransferase/methylenetetrahydrofolate reductase [Nitrospinota bacterium]
MTQSFKEALADGLLVCDGAGGTMFYSKGVTINRCYEELNLTQPDLVREVHREYIKAGADIIETNTFGANTFKLRQFGLEEKLESILKAGAALALEEGRGAVHVAGSIGPLGVSVAPYGKLPLEEATSEYRRITSILAETGVDLLMFETFHDLTELITAVKSAREVVGDLPIAAQMAFEEDGKTVHGATPAQVVQAMEKLGVDAVGANCSVGPAGMLDVIKEMTAATALPVIAQPNAGMPKEVEDRLIYLTTPDYLMTFGKRFIRAGARIVGGCCGTTPAHIAALKGAALALSPSRVEIISSRPDGAAAVVETPTAEKTPFAAKLAAGEWVSSVELLPPKGANPEKVMIQAKSLKDAGVDCINIPDGPRAMARMSPMPLALLFKNEIGIEPILHYTCRDRNLLGMQSDILGAHAIGVRNMLAITGDPPKLGAYPNATAVYDVDAIGLVKMISNLNKGQDIVGNPIDGHTAIHIGVGCNPGAANIDEELRRFEKKVEAGAEFCMTQPVFDPDTLFRFLERIRQFSIPALVGILPLASSRSAEFLHNEVPGMQIPADIRRRMAEAGDSARNVGVQIAREALAQTRDAVAGAYIMAPVGGAKTALKVLEK